MSKVVNYFYDSSGRMTKLGAGSSGTTDPTEYVYSGTTGMLSQVKYTAGANVSTATYYYDNGGRLTRLVDWIEPSGGLYYGYDDVTPLA